MISNHRIFDITIVRWIVLLTVVISNLGQAQSSTPNLPLPCTVEPQVVAVSFFELIESRDGEPRLADLREQVLSRQLLTSFRDVQFLIRRTKDEYDIDQHEAPLTSRLVGSPQIVDPVNPEADVSVKLLALNARGKVEQRVSLTCESQLWKVVSFSYGRPGAQ